MVVLSCAGAEVARWPLLIDAHMDIGVVDELARLSLAARRLGCSVRLREACPQLVELLDLAGVAGVLLEPRSGQVGGQAEGGEEGGVEEVVVADDPVP